ncbi:MAG: membrane protein insertase YidC [Acidobacteria bacterium]|nr:membrane protein insertase YidC [Acidobacteriota bacterium]
MDNNNTGTGSQGRFLVAAVLCLLVLFGWQYFFAPKKPATDANANANVAANSAPATPAPTQAPTPERQPQTAAVTPDTTPNRTITIKSPLYEVTLDSKGAVATSWIILRNKSPRNDFRVWAGGSTSDSQKPLQLISSEALNRSPREVPFRLSTDDQSANSVINDRNYQISVADQALTLNPGEERQIDFTLTDASGVEVKKSFVFRADSYVADLAVTLRKGGQPVPNTKVAIGATLGDQGIDHHTYWGTESEAVALVNGAPTRHLGASLTYDANGNAVLAENGNIDWAGVGDAYFSMAAVPQTAGQGLEYRASKYDVQTAPFYTSVFKWVIRSSETTETRHLITAFLPIASDGSVTKVFTGPKDYFLLNSLSAANLGRDADLTNLINFSNYSWIRPVTKPIIIAVLYSLNFVNSIARNYGVAIILLTIIFYSLLFPLRWSQSKSFKKASGNQPKMKELQDKIKDLQKKGVPNDDPRMRELQMQQLKMTKDAIPLGGCLPMILQFPLLIAFYTSVSASLEVRQASFLWLPDLSAADPWHVLEFAFAFSMILSMKFTPQAATVTPEQQMQQKMMTYFMPIMMLWVMWTAPSGLLLYWFAGNIVSFGQQMLINRLNKPKVPPGTAIVDSVPKGAKQVKPKLGTT